MFACSLFLMTPSVNIL